jgi:Uma2 family endonuclease
MFAHVRGIELYGYGSTTFKKEAAQRGAEPDECYVVGAEMREFPDIMIEVIHSVPLIDKLDVYADMGIPEVWIFRDGAFRLYALHEAGYGEIEQSSRIPGLDFERLAKFVVRTDTPKALREFEREIAG